MDKTLITILVPAFNEQEVIQLFYEKTVSVIEQIDKYSFEILFVNDGSYDNTLNILKELRKKDKRVSVLDLSRNYGKEIAMAAGFDYVKGDAVVIIDADLQDPPELIFNFIEKWEEGYDDVYAQRISREGETLLKRITSHYFYRILSTMSRVNVLKDTGDCRLLSKKALDSMRKIRESERYTKGLFSLVGHKKFGVKFHRDPRKAGQTKWNYFKLSKLAIQGITSFSTAPLKITTIVGMLFALIALVYMVVIVIKTLWLGEPVQGYPSLVSIVLFLGGIQLISLGIIGEYLGRVFMEIKGRPLYFVQDYESDFCSRADDRQHKEEFSLEREVN